MLENAFEKEHSGPIAQHHLALECIVSPDMGAMHLHALRDPQATETSQRHVSDRNTPACLMGDGLVSYLYEF